MFSLSCPVCGIEFEAKSSRRKYCSSRCKDAGKPSAQGLTCSVCGEPMARGTTSRANGSARHNACAEFGGFGNGHRRGCGCDECRSIKARKNAAYRDAIREREGVGPSTLIRRRIAAETGRWPSRRNGISSATRAQVYERDAGICQICFTAVDRNSPPDSDWFPSLDHIEPRSAVLFANNSVGNLRLAHRWCNSVRRERIFGDAEVRARALEKREVEGGAVHGREEAAEAGEAGRESSTAVLLGVNRAGVAS